MHIAVVTVEGAAVSFNGARPELTNDRLRVWIGAELVFDELKSTLRSWLIEFERQDSPNGSRGDSRLRRGRLPV